MSGPFNAAILTLPLYSNYGGILQAYALSTYLKQQGASPVLLNRRIQPDSKLKRLARFLLMRIPGQNIRNIRQQARKAVQLEPFVQRYIPLTPPLHSSASLAHYCQQNRIATLITGSDQVWRYQYTGRHWQDYFLGFIRTAGSKPKSLSLKKVAYGASFGTSEWQGGELDQVSALLQEFTAISVREVSGIQECQEKFAESRVQAVLDPTLLLTADHYRALSQRMPGRAESEDGTILATYLLDLKREGNELAAACSAYRHCSEQVALAEPVSSGQHYTIENWLYYIDQADFIVTDSFHGMVFAVIFQRPFVVLSNSERGKARFTSFLQCIGLEDRLIESPEQISPRIFSDIDYNAVLPRIKAAIDDSRQFLAHSVIHDLAPSYS